VKAGRELDELVATKVMGWSDKTPKGNHSETAWYGETGFYKKRYDYITKKKNFRPSTRISDAWQVQEKFIACTIFRDTDGYEVDLVYKRSQGWVRGVAETAPLAICLASLKAVGHEIEKAE
jgi:hypothetical protein